MRGSVHAVTAPCVFDGGFPEIDPLLSPIRPLEGGNQQIYCFVALSVWFSLARE